jgi:hypothetical protein
MKHIIKIFLATIIVFSLNSCEDSDKVINQVVADTEAGAILRTISDDSNSNVLNSSNPVIFLPQLVERWRDGNQNTCGRIEMSVEFIEMEGLENPPS